MRSPILDLSGAPSLSSTATSVLLSAALSWIGYCSCGIFFLGAEEAREETRLLVLDVRVDVADIVDAFGAVAVLDRETDAIEATAPRAARSGRCRPARSAACGRQCAPA